VKYSVKWIEDKLGITRSALKNYEAKGLMPKDASRNPNNNYREYNEDDIARIWSIKVLQGIGFSVKEIRDLIEDPEMDFYSAISNKVRKLENDREEIDEYIQFAKSIKLLDRVPTTSKVGSIRYDEFKKYALENWNFFVDTETAPCMRVMDSMVNKKQEDWDLEDLKGLQEFLEKYDHEKLEFSYTVNAYYRVIAEMQIMDYKSEPVQVTVKLLYEYILNSSQLEHSDKYIPELFAKYVAPTFLDGDIALLQQKNFGKVGSEFIARAIAYFGGYESIDDLY